MTEESKKYLDPKAGGWEAEFAGIYCEEGKRGTAFYANFSTDCGEGKVWIREYLSPSKMYGFKYVAKFVNQIGAAIGREELALMTADQLDEIYESKNYKFRCSADPVFILIESVDWNGKSFKKITSVAPYGEFPPLARQATLQEASQESPTQEKVELAQIDDDDVPF